MKTTPPPQNIDEASDGGLRTTALFGVFEPTLPTDFGYYWVTKKPGEKPVMLHLSPGKEYQRDARSVEAWDCPGIGRSRLDLMKMPRWVWVQILPPNARGMARELSALDSDNSNDING